MIELTNIKSTDKIRQLRGQINTMQNEIMADQPFVGLCQDISIKAFNGNSVTSNIAASSLDGNKLYALCLPKGDAVFVAKVFGRIQFKFPGTTTFNRIQIDIPHVKLATRAAEISKFIAPGDIGLGKDFSPNTMYTGAGWYAEDNDTTAKLLFTIIYSNGAKCNVGMNMHNKATITNDGTKTSTIYL